MAEDGPPARSAPRPPWSWPGEVSGALGDLGTFLPYVVAALAAGLLSPAPVLTGFAAGYLLVACVYRVPVAVQPMKALGAMLLAGTLAGQDVVWAGATIGACLLLFAATPALASAARAIPQSVVTGLQAGLGLMLGTVAVALMAGDWRLAAPAACVLALSYRWPRGPWALAVVLGAVWWAAPGAAPLTDAGVANLPGSSGSPAAAGAGPEAAAVLAGVAAQLPLTLLNAVVVSAAVARSCFPLAHRTVDERRLAATSGLLNLLLVPLGAMPMCHGAGGTAAHHRFGARGVAAPLLLASLCALGALAGPQVIGLLARIPMPVVGALLLFAALELVLSRRIFDARPDCRPVIAAAALVTWAGGALVGLLAGLAAEAVRARLARRNAARRADTG